MGARLGGRILSYVKSGEKTVGKKTLRAGMKVLNDVVNTSVERA